MTAEWCLFKNQIMPHGGGREFIMAFTGICPYIKDMGKGDRTVCECASFTFPDKVSRSEVLYGYCGLPTEWNNCMFKKVMDGYYERKFELESEAMDERRGASVPERRKIKTELLTVGKGRIKRCSI